MALRLRSSLFLLARNTSASSSNSTHPHRCEFVKMCSRFFSTSLAFSPMSPHVTGKRGRPVSSAIVSAVEDLPTPGTPCRRIIKPRPLPLTMLRVSWCEWSSCGTCVSDLWTCWRSRISPSAVCSTGLEPWLCYDQVLVHTLAISSFGPG